ncbi:radical SAM protein [Rhodoplanes sp. Z2-YC6860]|uniref:radical SAM protein n=1 Tax=Rhodoplanes sp. Z2-YC6860 TaxID=674703 RepID=UPI00078DD2BC|nr:radical SAM protein [Rhodoplanes sp. Z2-YC6860]AMN42737.1 hypothetical protein RHPLAN_43070 [Rhodoplanes sp. Z2-YC6860]
MPRPVEARGLIFSLRHAPCAHICRYCLVSETRKGTKLPFSRFEQLVHRFYDWRDSGGTDIVIRTFIGPSFDYDIETLEGVRRLRARRGNAFEILNLGGLRMRDPDALKVWMDERQAAGIVGFHTSLAGCGKVHDRWNGRPGDFDYQISILRMAAERGMVCQERLFLTKNTLPVFDELLDIMESIPGEPRRTVTPYFYAGLARRYEDERITEDIRDALPARIMNLRRGRFNDWRSEREWIPMLMETADQPRKLAMKLDVHEGNIDELEQSSCEEILARQDRLYRDDYSRMPSFEELCARYGDTDGRKIYMQPRDLEGKWMDMHERETGIKIPLD